jgi:hypothetical protein
MKIKREYAIALGFLLAGITLRVLFAALIPNEPVFDFATYIEIAQNIYNGLGHSLNGEPNAWSCPAYPFALAGFFRLFGQCSYELAKAFNIILSVLTMADGFFILRKLIEKEGFRLAVFAALCLMPSYIAYVNVAGTEVLFVFLLLAHILLMLYLPDTRVIKPLILGLSCALLTYTKSFMLVYPVITACFMRTSGAKWTKTLASFAIMMLAVLAALSPWIVRNYNAYGRIVTTTYNMGYVMYINNNDANESGKWMDPADVPKSAEDAAFIDEKLQGGKRGVKSAYDLEPLFKQRANEWIARNPLGFAKLGLLRVRETFFTGANDVDQWASNGLPYYGPGEGGAKAVLISLWRFGKDTVYTVLNAVGLLFLFIFLPSYARKFFACSGKLSELEGLTYINIAFLVVVPFLFEGQARYGFPALMFMVLAAAGLIFRVCAARGRL